MKEAVVLILDANSSMAQPYNGAQTRFDCAKQVCVDLICDLMVRSKTHEVDVVVLKSKETHHHWYGPGRAAMATLPKFRIPTFLKLAATASFPVSIDLIRTS